MALPTCPKPDCNSHLFSTQILEPSGSAFKLFAVCCSRCGAVVGVMDYYNLGSMLVKLGKKLGVDVTKA